jgi:hypothetical protein
MDRKSNVAITLFADTKGCHCTVGPALRPSAGERFVACVCELPHGHYFLCRADLRGIAVSVSFESVVAVPAVLC